jgi:hypothetical protein
VPWLHKKDVGLSSSHKNLKPLACNTVKVCLHLVLVTLVLSPLTPY